MKSAPQNKKPWLLEAFRELETERNYVSTMQSVLPTAIPLKRIHWFGKDWLRLDNEELDAFVWIIRQVDNHFVSKAHEKAVKKAK